MTLDVFEFIRRFLLHVLPKRFVKIRYYGLLCNRYRKQNLVFCRYLLKVYINEIDNISVEKSWQDILFRLTGKDLSICPECGGNMVSADDFHFNINRRCSILIENLKLIIQYIIFCQTSDTILFCYVNFNFCMLFNTLKNNFL